MSETGTEVLAAFDLPPGRTPASYFANVDGASLGLLIGALLLCLFIYLALVRKGGAIAQAVGWFLILLVVVFLATGGLVALREVFLSTFRLLMAWVTTT